LIAAAFTSKLRLPVQSIGDTNRFSGKEKRLALGVYPRVGLKEARKKCDETRKRKAPCRDYRLEVNRPIVSSY
jgi:hypothetical protein